MIAEQTCYLVHYHEIALKGANRAFFENQLRKNLLRAAATCGLGSVRLLRGRVLIETREETDHDRLRSVLQHVFGIAYFAPAHFLEQDLEAITRTAVAIAKCRAFQSFRIVTHRSQKAFPMTSVEVNIAVGRAVQQATGAAVDLKHAELRIYIEIFDKNALVYCERIPGAGGLPVGVSDRAVVLLSSGIDSPVAAYKIMRRGVQLTFVHFHSVPFTSPASIENTVRLVRHLTRYQFKSTLYLVPFLSVQQHITSVTPPGYRVLLYRRLMMRIAERIALRNRAIALVTGENVGQVASQTLPNMRAINEVVSLPVLRPLAGEDKQDIIAMAEKIGTYPISIEPYDDCCSLFVPGNPETRAKLPKVHEYESQIDVDGLIEAVLNETEIRRFTIDESE